MFVELAITQEDQDYFIKGTADLKSVKPALPNSTKESPIVWTKIVFKTRSIKEIMEWQKPLFANDKCILKVDGEEYKGQYETYSRIDGGPIIFLYKQIDFENK